MFLRNWYKNQIGSNMLWKCCTIQVKRLDKSNLYLLKNSRRFSELLIFYYFACNCLCGEDSGLIRSGFLSLKFSKDVLVGDNWEGLAVSVGLELRDCSSSADPNEVPCGTPPVSTYCESSAWNDGTVTGDLAHGNPKAGLNIGGNGRPGQKWWSEVTWCGKPRCACRAKSGIPGWSKEWCMNGPASLPKAFSRLRHFARRFWNQTWKKTIIFILHLCALATLISENTCMFTEQQGGSV